MATAHTVDHMVEIKAHMETTITTLVDTITITTEVVTTRAAMIQVC